MTLESILSAVIIMCMRIADVTLGTFRTMLVVQAKKYHAAFVGFFEVLIWILAMSYIVQHLDNTINLIGYALGFALGNILGVTLEQRVAIGFSQVNIVSLHHTDDIANKLRMSNFGVTILPGEGSTGGVSIIIVIIKRKHLEEVLKIVESIDKRAFITVQHSRPYRGYMHGPRV
ncbi:MAG: DUF5698 domain-containing protein [Melioribacter sp.]|uniref:DUF2179 domain-containing protein n=1 Tax=Rosettibacter primus TaxID=3111523 RepID=UPI00247B79C2|nr:DUF5698 domain-containing protein [Melioribacter sp.]